MAIAGEYNKHRVDQKGWEAVLRKSRSRSRVRFLLARDLVESDRRGQALVEMTVVGRAGQSWSALDGSSSRSQTSASDVLDSMKIDVPSREIAPP
jgi:hypothetical protein